MTYRKYQYDKKFLEEIINDQLRKSRFEMNLMWL